LEKKFKVGTHIGTHTRPDVDAIFAIALLKQKYRIDEIHFTKEGDVAFLPQILFRNMKWVDRGRRDYDHHGKVGTSTSTELVAREIGLDKEKWIQPILSFVEKVDLEGKSLPFDMNDILKSIVRESKVSDEKIMEIGLKIANALITFHKEGLRRNNTFALEVIKEFLIPIGKEIPERFKKYMEDLQNSKFQRTCDFCEIIIGVKKLQGKERAVEFGKLLLSFLYKDFERFQEATEEVKKAQIIKVGRYTLVAGISDNPKFNPAARKILKADVIIQKNSSGHVQIYFNYQTLKNAKEIAKEIIKWLRILECHTQKRVIPKRDLKQAERIEEIPEWYLFMPKGCPLILNGSLTAPEVPVTKIPFEQIIATVEITLRDFASHRV